MLRRLGILFTCLAMFFIAGGHWAVLQSVAWAGMLRDYARTESVVTAVQKTFSGKYPCAMCRKIGEQQQQDQKTPLAKDGNKKIEGISPALAEAAAPAPVADFSYPRAGKRLLAARFDAPPAPVPILG